MNLFKKIKQKIRSPQEENPVKYVNVQKIDVREFELLIVHLPTSVSQTGLELAQKQFIELFNKNGWNDSQVLVVRDHVSFEALKREDR